MSTNNNSSNNGIGFFGLLTVVFITLKLTHFIDWSWWWVLSPLWMPIALVAIVALIWFLNEIRKEYKKGNKYV